MPTWTTRTRRSPRRKPETVPEPAPLPERPSPYPRTVEGWEQGRKISKPAKLLLAWIFKKQKGTK